MSVSQPDRKETRIAILGAGNMGTGMAQALALQGRTISIWDHFPEVVREVREKRTNRKFLPDVQLHPDIHAVSDAGECVTGAEIVIVCVPSAFAATTLEPVIAHLEKNAHLVNVAKGFSPDGTEILPKWLGRLTPDHSWSHLAGPALAREFARGLPTFLTIASDSPDAASTVAEALSGKILVPSVTRDLEGAVLCGILKNSYAMLMGMLETLGPEGDNLKASALVLCGLEMSSVLIAQGAAPETVRGLAGMGDLLATGLAPESHNRNLGKLLGEGRTLAEVEADKGWLPEGAKATPLFHARAEAQGQEAPLLRFLNDVLTGAKPDSARLIEAFRTAARSV